MTSWNISRHYWKLAFILICAPVLASCATQTAGSDQLRRVSSITVVRAENPNHFGLAVGDVGLALGAETAVGPGAMAGVLAGSLAGSGKATALDAALASQDIKLGSELTTAVQAAVAQDGYMIISEGQSADATLLLQIEESTYERRVWGKIGPHLVIEAILMSRDSGERIFHRIYRYDMHTISLGPTKGLTPDDAFGFDSPQEVLAHPAVVAAGFRAAIPMIASDVALALKR